MPEGPSLVILKEELAPFKGRRITAVNGYAKIDLTRLHNKTIKDIKSWGKHCLICFDTFFIRIHLLLFGKYLINDSKSVNPVLSLTCGKGVVNFYTASVVLVEGRAEGAYDWETDLMSDLWNPKKAEKALKQLPDEKVCDVLLDQEVFSGSGNIIKNEVLFRIKVHPETQVGNLPLKKLRELIKDARTYSLLFYKWKKANVLKRHWQIYKRKTCPRCNIPAEIKYMGKGKRLTCFCSNCQVKY